MSEQRRYRAILGQHKDPVIASFIKTETGTDRYAYTHAYSSAQARRNIIARLGRDVPIIRIEEAGSETPDVIIALSSEEFDSAYRGLIATRRYAQSKGAVLKVVGAYRWKDRSGNYIEYKRQLAVDMIEVYNSVRRTRETVKIKRRA